MKVGQEDIAVCFVSNRGYFQHFYAALASFLDNNPGGHEVFLFNEDIPDSAFATLNDWVKSRSPESQVFDVKLDTSVLPEFTGYWEKLGKQVFHRLLIPDELPKRFNYALYVDADIIFYQPFAIDPAALEGHTITAIRDSISDILSPKRDLEKYFNAGIMFINIQAWKAKDSLARLLNHTPKKTLFAEQELLNEVFAGDWYELDQKFNYPSIHIKKQRGTYVMKNGDVPVNIHFLGGVKPWRYWVPGSALYWQYVARTPFRRKTRSIPQTMLKSFVHLLRKRFN